MTRRGITSLIGLSLLAGCRATPGSEGGGLPERVVVELFPGVRVVQDGPERRRWVEIDGFVPIMDDPHAPDVYLELIMCRRDTRDHEVLVATDALPSHIHAALLMLGLEPGHPASWTYDGGRRRLVPQAPAGPEVAVSFAWAREGEPATATPSDWVVHLGSGERLPVSTWRFAGSVETDHPAFRYGADGSGNIIGLTTFGDEVVAYPEVISPEAAIDEPVWVADFAAVPPFGTRVVVRLTPILSGR